LPDKEYKACKQQWLALHQTNLVSALGKGSARNAGQIIACVKRRGRKLFTGFSAHVYKAYYSLPPFFIGN